MSIKEIELVCRSLSHCTYFYTLRESSLKQHVLVHTGEKPYLCSQCDNTFSTERDLKQHLLTHTGDEAYHCTYCEKSFSTNSNLKKHNIHISEDTYGSFATKVTKLR